MSIDIGSFKSIVKSVAKPSLFKCSVGNNTYAGLSGTDNGTSVQTLFEFTCKAAQLPGSTIGKIDFPYMDRKIPFPGSRTYNDWTCTVILNGNYTLYKRFRNWHASINMPEENTASDTNTWLFKTDIIIDALDTSGTSVNKIKIVDAFPTTVDDLQLDWSSNDTALEMNVTFAYSYCYWE